MDWKHIFNSNYIKQMFPDLNSIGKWVEKNTIYPFFCFENKIYWVTINGEAIFSGYEIINNKIVKKDDELIFKIIKAYKEKKLVRKKQEEKKIWRGFEITFEDHKTDISKIKISVKNKKTNSIHSVIIDKI